MGIKKLEEIKMTPEMANEILERNKNNRKIRLYVVDRYARDMANGKWEINGDTIVFDESGNLTDGQHRLMAVVKAGVTVDMIAVYGIPFSATKDIGLPRSIADNIRMQYGLDAVDGKIVGNLNMIASYAGLGSKLSPSEYVKLYNYFEEYLLIVKNVPNQSKISCPVQCAAIILMSETGFDKNTAVRFLSVYTDGYIDGEKENAAIAFKNWMSGMGDISRTGNLRKLAMRTAIGAMIQFSKKNPSKRVARPKDIDLSNLKQVVFES